MKSAVHPIELINSGLSVDVPMLPEGWGDLALSELLDNNK